ncbi:MAG: HD domain-containing protein [SAR324 cluster bacterium]|nr:HD domain-containing protein [SAR324 cluster bacterium]
MRRITHFIFAAALLSVYGIQVCPFIETLSPTQIVFPIVAVFTFQYFMVTVVMSKRTANLPLEIQSRGVFVSELALFLLSGFFITIFNMYVYQFPLGSGMKLVVGFLGFGLFCAVDMSLEHERKLAQRFKVTGESFDLDARFFSQPNKLFIFVTLASSLMAGVFFLVVNKDLDWLMTVGSSITLKEARRAILGEVLFVVSISMFHSLNVIRSYAKNLKTFFDDETEVLQRASEGDFGVVVPVASLDEFGLIAQKTNHMVAGLRAATEKLQLTQDATIIALASLAEARDNETGAHILRTQAYVKALALHLQKHPDFSAILTDEYIDLVFKSAPLHDIGKVGIQDHILLKPGKLDFDEFEIMKTHATIGGVALDTALKTLGDDSFLSYAKEIAMSHHEKWDGSGYPAGLSGEAIPLSGRLMAVADVYDALISTRAYKKGFSHEKAKEIILEGEGKHFDTRLIQAFREIENEFVNIARELSEPGSQG